MTEASGTLIDEYIEFRHRRLSLKSQVEYRRDLEHLQGWLVAFYKDIAGVSQQDIAKYLNAIAVSNKTANRKLAVFRSFYAYLVDRDIIDRSPADRIENFKTDKMLPKVLSQQELNFLFSYNLYPEGHYRTLLFQAAVMLAYLTGVRASELISINLNDIDRERQEIRVFGKGGKERIVRFASAKLLPSLETYLQVRQGCAEPNEQALFVNEKGQRINLNFLENMFRRIHKKTGLPVTPHYFRHTFATYALNGGMNLAEVQFLLGHADISTTGIYVHVTESISAAYDKAFG